MLKKLCLVLLLVACLTESVVGDASVERWPWFPIPPRPHFRVPFPHPPFHFPYKGKALPPLPAGGFPVTKPDPKVAKCFKDLHIEHGCVSQIIASYYTHKLKLDSECCKVVAEISDDCVCPVFAHFNNPFFAMLLKQHCSAKSPPSP